MGWNCLSIPKLQRLYRWILGMDKLFHPIHYNGCDYLSMLWIKLMTNQFFSSLRMEFNLFSFLCVSGRKKLIILTGRTIHGITLLPPDQLTSSLQISLHWRQNGRYSVSNHQSHDCLLNSFIQMQFKETINAPRSWPLCEEFTGEFLASYAENVSIWWRHHVQE